MALYYRDLVNILIPRAERLGLVVEGTPHADAVELEMYMFNALLGLIELNDLEDYTLFNDRMIETQAGIEKYPLPDDFGRLVLPTDMLTRGLHLYNGVDVVPLTYLDPEQFFLQTPVEDREPEVFTVQRRTVYLYPTPETQYTVRGSYIERAGRPELDDEVRLTYPTALIEETLFKLASDAGRITQSLATMRTEALAKLTGGPLGNPERIGQRFVERKAG